MFQEKILAQYDGSTSGQHSRSSDIEKVLKKLRRTAWGETPPSTEEDDSLLAHLLGLRTELRAMETQRSSAQMAYDALASLSAPNSALVALENARQLLYGFENRGDLSEKLEKTHELLNDAEVCLNSCARSIDDVVSTLEQTAIVEVSIEELDVLVADWNALARKHGISVSVLCTCRRQDSVKSGHIFSFSSLVLSVSCAGIGRGIPVMAATLTALLPTVPIYQRVKSHLIWNLHL